MAISNFTFRCFPKSSCPSKAIPTSQITTNRTKCKTAAKNAIAQWSGFREYKEWKPNSQLASLRSHWKDESRIAMRRAQNLVLYQPTTGRFYILGQRKWIIEELPLYFCFHWNFNNLRNSLKKSSRKIHFIHASHCHSINLIIIRLVGEL